ncbi:hypothetical protein PHYSODRAFT_405901, partial [Phytophthora sojae]
LSFWGEANGSAGGTGILINPHGAMKNVTPLWQDRWSPRLTAVLGDLAGQRFALINLYAPIDRTEREKFFDDVMRLPRPADVPVFLGGDFNCTFDPVLDRTLRRTTSSHDSPALRILLKQWELTDCLRPMMPLRAETERLESFQQAFHTYHYNVDDFHVSSRLDRWYASIEAQRWVAQVDVLPTGLSDHDGVLSHLRSPSNPIRVKRPVRAYPVPPHAKSLVDASIRGALDSFGDWLEEGQSASATAIEWDSLKRRI